MTEVSEFVDENRDWLEEQADSDMPAAWVADALLDAHPEGVDGE